MTCNGFCTVCPFGCKTEVIFVKEEKKVEQPKVEVEPATDIVPVHYKVKKTLLGNLVAKEIKTNE